MDSQGIEAFLAVVRHGSLTEAANSLFLSQSTLSHRISQLEREVGMKLIDRGRGLRSLSLTASGQEFLDLAKRWGDLVQETKHIRSRTKNLNLSIGATDTIHTYILPPVYEALCNYSGNMNIHVSTYQSAELYTLLEHGKIDIAFAFREQPMPSMIIKKFYTEPMVVIRKEHSPTAHRRIIHQEELDPSSELHINWNPSFQAWYDRWRGENEHPIIRVDTAQLMLTFMDRPGKWAIVPLSMAESFQQTGSFALYELEDPPPDREYYQIQPRHPRVSASKAIDTLQSCLHAVMN